MHLLFVLLFIGYLKSIFFLLSYAIAKHILFMNMSAT